MFVFKRNQIIITVLVFMIAIAAYLNIKDPSAAVTPSVVDNMQATAEEVADKDFFNQFEDKNTIDTLAPDEYVATEDANTIAATADTAKNETMVQTATDNASEIATNDQVQIKKQEEGIQAVITKKTAKSLMDDSVPANKTMEVSYFVEEKMLREQSRASQVEQLTQYVANENLDKDSKAKAAENLLVIQQRIEKESSAESLLRAKGFKDVFVRMDDKTVDVVINKADLTDDEIAQIEEIVHRKTGYAVGQIRITPLNATAQNTTTDQTKNQ